MEGKRHARRTFLEILATALGGLGLLRSGAMPSMRPSEGAPDLAVAKLLGGLQHRDSAARVGRQYLHTVQGESDGETLIQLICSSSPESRRWIAHADVRAVGEWLRFRQREDFELGRVVRVNGWVLSATEARVCALAACYEEAGSFRKGAFTGGVLI